MDALGPSIMDTIEPNQQKTEVIDSTSEVIVRFSNLDNSNLTSSELDSIFWKLG